MSEDQERTPDAEEPARSEPKPENKSTGIVETAVGLAVLGLGAAVVSGGFGLGGIVKTLTRGVPSGTPPIAPPPMRPPQG